MHCYYQTQTMGTNLNYMNEEETLKYISLLAVMSNLSNLMPFLHYCSEYTKIKYNV